MRNAKTWGNTPAGFLVPKIAKCENLERKEFPTCGKTNRGLVGEHFRGYQSGISKKALIVPLCILYLREIRRKRMTKVKKIALLILSMLLPSLTVAGYAIFARVSPVDDTSAKINIKDVRMYYVGNNQVLDSFLDRAQLVGAQTTPLEMQELKRTGADLTAMSVVLMDGGWISQQVSNTEVHAFLRQAVSQGAKLAAIGGSTAAFLEALDKAKINELPRNETTGSLINPAGSSNPLVVGFKLIQATTPYGEQYSVPSILLGGNAEAYDMFDYITSWIGS